MNRGLLQDLLHFAEEIKVMVFGGYHQAERVRLVLLPAFFLPEAVSPPLAYLEVKGKSKKDFQPNHRDLLGSLTGLGIKREKIGDILPVDGGAQVILAKEIEEYVLTHLSQVGAVPVEVAPIDPEQLNVQPQRVKEVTTTVASLRLDAVAGAGFGVSRKNGAGDQGGKSQSQLEDCLRPRLPGGLRGYHFYQGKRTGSSERD